ncbi:MAG: ImmA/IrrE family metallo-endopeptidase [Pseudobacteriovorax sp.]|nr:ImmA/IrrE family metallo-endopeptidase [Pseudobacteriovorax sp.]
MLAIFPEIAATAGQGDIELLSCLVRKYFAGTNVYNPRLNVESIVSAVGISYSNTAMPYYGVLAAKDEGGRMLVTIANQDSDLSPLEKNFLLGHQLGHFFLHVQPYLVRGEWKNTGFKEDYKPMQRYLQPNYEVLTESAANLERQADEFSAALLMPMGMVKRAVEKLQDTKKVAELFAVSEPLISRRLEDIGLLSRTVRENVLDELPKEQRENENQKASSVNLKTQNIEAGSGERGFSPPKASPGSIKQPPKVDSQSSHSEKNPIENSLKMFRELAKKLDKSVDP